MSRFLFLLLSFILVKSEMDVTSRGMDMLLLTPATHLPQLSCMAWQEKTMAVTAVLLAALTGSWPAQASRVRFPTVLCD